ncbi:MAG: class I SAM-dependent methyltransferase, partial [Dehalococcoidia bacterium]|nr:class I SAM-dependent methyltransferase [Dehalococcoidia bacterium]
MQNTDHLRAVAYKDAARLNARIKFWQRYGTPRDVWFGRFFDLVDAPPGARVLELGCGPAGLWRWGLDNARVPDGWSITLTDLSDGMLEEARRNLAGFGRDFRFET